MPPSVGIEAFDHGRSFVKPSNGLTGLTPEIVDTARQALLVGH